MKSRHDDELYADAKRQEALANKPENKNPIDNLPEEGSQAARFLESAVKTGNPETKVDSDPNAKNV